MCFVIALLLPSIRPDGRWSWDTFSAGYRNGGSDKCDGIPMDSLITAAARALAAGDPLGALKRVALRDDAPALALRGIAMAQLGDLVRAKRSEEHTSELQSRLHLVCRLLLEKKKRKGVRTTASMSVLPLPRW